MKQTHAQSKNKKTKSTSSSGIFKRPTTQIVGQGSPPAQRSTNTLPSQTSTSQNSGVSTSNSNQSDPYSLLLSKKILKKNREFKFETDEEFKESMRKPGWLKQYQEQVLCSQEEVQHQFSYGIFKSDEDEVPQSGGGAGGGGAGGLDAEISPVVGSKRAYPLRLFPSIQPGMDYFQKQELIELTIQQQKNPPSRFRENKMRKLLIDLKLICEQEELQKAKDSGLYMLDMNAAPPTQQIQAGKILEEDEQSVYINPKGVQYSSEMVNIVGTLFQDLIDVKEIMKEVEQLHY